MDTDIRFFQWFFSYPKFSENMFFLSLGPILKAPA